MKMSKKLLSLVLAATMTLGMGAAAFAADGGDTTAPKKYDLSQAYMTKDLEVADGINIDSVKSFTFSFTKGESGTDTAARADHIKIADQTITVAAQSGGHAYGNKKLSEIFTDANEFPHAGEYVYKVKETTTASSTTSDGVKKSLTVDSTEYKVHVYVANDGDNLKFDGITVEKDGEKVDPTIQGGTSGFNFVNKYTEVIGDDKTAALTIEKKIDGDYGDKTKQFPITVKLTIPSTATAADVAVTGGDFDSSKLEVTAELANDGKIEFKTLPAGTTFKVEETQDKDYKGKIEGSLVKTEIFKEGDHVSAISTGPVVSAGNTVTITNTRDSLVPTGILINNLPYFLLVVIAFAGVAYMQMKKRRV